METQAPTDYARTFRVTFNVEITDEGLVTFEQDALRQVQPNNNTTANATATVLNVKNVTQLPLTGAAGTVLFTVVALLVAVPVLPWRSRAVAARTERVLGASELQASSIAIKNNAGGCGSSISPAFMCFLTG